MKVIAIIAQKGGAKKTTTATNLAVAGCEQGLETILFDANTDQPTANKWSILRRNIQEKEIPIVVSSPQSLLQDNIKKAQANGADLVIIDTGAQSNNTALTASRLADLVVIPTPAGIFDLWEVSQSLDIALLAGKPAVVVMTDMSYKEAVREIEERELRKALVPLKADICPHYTTHRDTYPNAAKAGLAVMEYRRHSLASQEMQAIYQWICNRVNL